MRALLKLSGVIDAINTQIGRWAAWLILVAVVVSAGNATVRKVFDVSSNSWLELQWMLFSAVFLLCAPWTLLEERAYPHRYRQQPAAAPASQRD